MLKFNHFFSTYNEVYRYLYLCKNPNAGKTFLFCDKLLEITFNGSDFIAKYLFVSYLILILILNSRIMNRSQPSVV